MSQNSEPSTSKIVRCDECGKKLSRAAELPRHKKIHKLEKDYICDFCGHGFVQKSNLKTHIRTHTKEKLKCPDCNFLNGDPAAISRHRQREHAHVPARRAPRADGPSSGKIKSARNMSRRKFYDKPTAIPIASFSRSSSRYGCSTSHPSSLSVQSSSTLHASTSQSVQPRTSSALSESYSTYMSQLRFNPQFVLPGFDFDCPGLEPNVPFNWNGEYDLSLENRYGYSSAGSVLHEQSYPLLSMARRLSDAWTVGEFTGS